MTETRNDNRRRSLFVAAGFTSLLVAGLVGTSLAVFTDSSQVSGNVFSLGSVDISTDSDGSALFTTTGLMSPGDTVFEPLVVNNVGSMELRYAMTSTMTAETNNANDLQQQIDLTVHSGVSGPDCTAGTVGGGSVLYAPGDLAGALNTPLNVLGDPATGSDAGDRVLAGSSPGPADSETLCFEAAVPLSTDESYAGHEVTIRFDFDAEQTANNL